MCEHVCLRWMWSCMRCNRWVEVCYLMLQNRCKTTYNTHTRIKCMNCIVAVVIAILALVIHVTNNFFEEGIKICPKMFPDICWQNGDIDSG